jgi:hypothetical protein
VPAKAAFEHVPEFSFNGGQVGVRELASWNHDDIEPGREFIVTEYFSDEALCSISDDCAAYLLGRRNPKPADRLAVRQAKYREQLTVNLDSAVIDPLVVNPAPNVFAALKTCRRYSLLTVRRFRPLARRLFKTSRPFLVLILTRKPCAFARRRRFG